MSKNVTNELSSKDDGMRLLQESRVRCNSADVSKLIKQFKMEERVHDSRKIDHVKSPRFPILSSRVARAKPLHKEV